MAAALIWAICFVFHVLIGATALAGAIILVTLTVLTEFMTRRPAREAMTLAARRNDLATASRRNAEVLVAMGMSGRLTKRWGIANENYLAGNQRTSDVAGGLGATAKVMRMMLQLGGAGGRRLSGRFTSVGNRGAIIASSILERALRCWRRSISRSRIGNPSSRRARAGTRLNRSA